MLFVPAELKTEPRAAADSGQEQRERSGIIASRWRLRWFLLSAVALLVLTVGYALVKRRTTTPIRRAIEPLNSSSASNQAVRLAGVVEAVRMRAVVVPLLAGEHGFPLTITQLAAGGSRVKQGDLLVEFDRQEQMREFLDKQAEYEKLVNQVIEEQAKEQAARAKDETEIREAQSNLSQAELEMQKVEIVSRIDAEKAQEALDEAKATLQQLRDTFDLKRKAAQAGIHILEIQRDRAQQVVQHAQANTELMRVRSPIDGVVVLNRIFEEGKMGEVQEGDQVNPGVTIMQVVDPSRMQVRASVNQEDLLRLQVGQTATVYLDAYRELAFAGRLEEIAPMGRASRFSSKVHSFSVVFSIDGHDAKLMPDLSAAIDVERAIQGSDRETSR